jgi:hypothetical protein
MIRRFPSKLNRSSNHLNMTSEGKREKIENNLILFKSPLLQL